ncbi:MAG: O-antigen ligase family protein [Candidatus Falkowbacteria bacterium]|nr:O-antigen ligase family protein [Candidatus Falkowbacteria bacterium]
MDLVLNKILNKKTVYLLGAFGGLELLSFIAYFYPGLNVGIFGIIILAALVLTIYRLEYGLLLLIAELIISSKGYLFAAGGLSLRLILFLIIFLLGVYKLLKNKADFAKLKFFRVGYLFGLVFLFLLLGVIQGYLRYGLSSNWFHDFNAWLFFALLPLLVIIYYKNVDQAVYNRLILVSSAAVIWLSLKTLFFFFIFAHDFSWSLTLYKWIRFSGVGEITNIGFNWPRVFLQSQIYAPLAFIFLLFWSPAAGRRAKFIYYSLLSLFLMTTLISFSRSFWVGLLAAYILAAILIIRRSSIRRWLKTIPGLLISALASLVLIYCLAFFPFPKSLVSFSADIFQRRANFLSADAAVASRWSQLVPLWQKVLEQPIFGQGYGTTITYKSSDPRILQDNPSGEYTTYAFEWGYLDIWLKIGFLGALAYLLLLVTVIKRGLADTLVIKLALATGLTFLLVTNIFTPYLNHPLGISYIMLSSCLIF